MIPRNLKGRRGEAPQPARESACAPPTKLPMHAIRNLTATGFAIVVFSILGTSTNCRAAGFAPQIVVSVADQELALIARGKVVKRFPVSTSKFGTGDAVGSYRTPLGETFVSAKVGDGLPAGAVIKNRNATGKILKANAPGRDAIVSRVIWLRGMDGTTANARDRCIYIHGTAEEQRIGRCASFGCIRMRSKDVIVLYNLVHIGTHVRISAKPLHDFLPPEEPSLLARAD
jgi:lipoprotein-anchoring transpeptidase ErfK/SrfK